MVWLWRRIRLDSASNIRTWKFSWPTSRSRNRMHSDSKREALRHLLATVAYRGAVAIADAPENFAEFRVHNETRTPGELLAHIGDLLEGSLYLCQGELVYLTSSPLPWAEEVDRFSSAIKQLDSYLSSKSEIACPVEKLIQGPIGDALTHVGQIVMLRRIAGKPVQSGGYFEAEIVPGES